FAPFPLLALTSFALRSFAPFPLLALSSCAFGALTSFTLFPLVCRLRPLNWLRQWSYLLQRRIRFLRRGHCLRLSHGGARVGERQQNRSFTFSFAANIPS